MTTKNISAVIREAYNVSIAVNETFTASDLATVSEVSTKEVNNYIFRTQQKGLCIVHDGSNKPFVYKKIKNDDTKVYNYGTPRKKNIDNVVKKGETINTLKYPNLNFTVEGTDEEIIDKLTPFVSNLKQMVIDLTDKVSTLQDKNKELLSDNDVLRAEVDEYRRNVPKLQEEVMKFRKTKAVRTITI